MLCFNKANRPTGQPAPCGKLQIRKWCVALIAAAVLVCLLPTLALADAENSDRLHWVGNVQYAMDNGIYVVGCKPGLTEVTVPARIYSFGDLIDIVGGIPVIGIRENAFAASPSLVKIIIGANVSAISAGAFVGCDSLTTIEVAASNATYLSSQGALVSKDGMTLHKCGAGLSLFTVPSTVTTIGASAFFDCRGLNAVVIPDTVTSIAPNAFAACRDLTILGGAASAAKAYAAANNIPFRVYGTSGLQAIGLAGASSLEAGGTAQLTAGFLPAASSASLQYASSDTAVAKVSATGLVTAVKAGTAVISATGGGLTAKHTVVVLAKGQLCLYELHKP